MQTNRKPRLTATLRIRISPETKEALMRLARSRGVSTARAFRDAVEASLARDENRE